MLAWVPAQLLDFLRLQGLVFSGGTLVKNLPAVQVSWVWSLGWKDSLEEEMATHSSIYAWKIPWTEEPGWLQSMGLQRTGGDGAHLGSPVMPLGLTVPRTTRDASRGKWCLLTYSHNTDKWVLSSFYMWAPKLWDIDISRSQNPDGKALIEPRGNSSLSQLKW